MGNMEEHLGNATSKASSHHLRDVWKSPRGTVLRIEALALLAIVLTFLLAAFGSCRRWSNRWIVQKGFLAANALSLSLGTYSIGLMQSSSVKSEMYPIWAVSLLTLFGCVDSVTTYNGLDYKSPLSKMIFQLCLYCGYVLLMSISTFSTDVGNLAIGVLSAITFFKGFHRSLALVLPSRMRKMIRELIDGVERYALSNLNDYVTLKWLTVDFLLDIDASPVLEAIMHNAVTMEDIHVSCKDNGELESDVGACKDVCFALSLSHLLHRRFLGLNDITTGNKFHLRSHGEVIDYKWALKLIEVELAFLYEVFFTGNAFLHYYQAKTASFWAFASFIGISFVAVVVAIPGTRTSHYTTSHGSGAGTIVVDTTTSDLVITLVILVSLALLQLVQLIRCWTSNWARVALACQYAWNKKYKISHPKIWWWWMRLKAFAVARINWFDKYLWQDKLGQYSIIEGSSRRKCKLFSGTSSWGGRLYKKCFRLLRMLGLQYIGQVLQELWGSDSTGPALRLHTDVKASIADFLGQIKSDTTGKDWSSLLVLNGVDIDNLPYTPLFGEVTSDARMFTSRVMKWHIATCYCELAEHEQRKQDNLLNQIKEDDRTGCRETEAVAGAACFRKKAAAAAVGEAEKNRRAAVALSKYWAYLVVSVPELLPGPCADTKHVYDRVAAQARRVLHGAKGTKDKLEAMQGQREHSHCHLIYEGVALGKRLLEKTPSPRSGRRCSDPWKVLALFWVQALLYAAAWRRTCSISRRVVSLSHISGLCCTTSASTSGKLGG
ncbi:hypothetical protein ACP70R_015109 [Stipagrostis hirtigluma subsp. patula]